MSSLIFQITPTPPVNIKFADSPFSAQGGDFIRCDATDGPIIINLPSATGSGAQIFFKKLDASANSCTAQGNGLVDNAAAVVAVNQFQSVSLSDGAAGVWDIF